VIPIEEPELLTAVQAFRSIESCADLVCGMEENVVQICLRRRVALARWNRDRPVCLNDLHVQIAQ
jgi:hypothetical protein